MQPIVGLITRRTWSRITLALETEQDLFEAREVRGIGARTCDSLALRVLKLDDITNALPCRALRERCREVTEELFLMLPVACARQEEQPQESGRGWTHLFSRMLRSFFAEYSS